MNSFPRFSRLLKGALVGVDPRSPLASLVVSQFNPDKTTRSLKIKGVGAGERGRHRGIAVDRPADRNHQGGAEIEARKGLSS
jgi:hypothetical protein